MAYGVTAFVQYRRAAGTWRPVGRDVQLRGRFQHFAVLARSQKSADDTFAVITALAMRVAVADAVVAGEHIRVEREWLQVIVGDAEDADVRRGVAGQDFCDGTSLSAFIY